MKKLLLHIPHASLNIPFRDGYINDPVKIENEQLKLTKYFFNFFILHCHFTF